MSATKNKEIVRLLKKYEVRHLVLTKKGYKKLIKDWEVDSSKNYQVLNFNDIKIIRKKDYL